MCHRRFENLLGGNSECSSVLVRDIIFNKNLLGDTDTDLAAAAAAAAAATAAAAAAGAEQSRAEQNRADAVHHYFIIKQ